MKYGVYSIFDSAAGVFTVPTIDISDGSASRSFERAVMDGGSMMNYCPDDFVLYKVGTFNVETGFIEPVVPPEVIRRGHLVKED